MSRGVRREGLSRRHRFRGQDCFRPLLRSPRKFTGTLAEPARFKAEGSGAIKPMGKPAQATEVRVRKPSGHAGH